MTDLEEKVLIVISDGADNSSRHSLADVLRAAGLSNAIVYTVGLFDEDNAGRNPGVLRRMARATGGEAFLPQQTRDVVRICRHVAQDIRSQHAIGYTPIDRNFDGSYRKIDVVAGGPGRSKFVVRTRSGYLASPEWSTRAASPGEVLR